MIEWRNFAKKTTEAGKKFRLFRGFIFYRILLREDLQTVGIS